MADLPTTRIEVVAKDATALAANAPRPLSQLKDNITLYAAIAGLTYGVGWLSESVMDAHFGIGAMAISHEKAIAAGISTILVLTPAALGAMPKLSSMLAPVFSPHSATKRVLIGACIAVSDYLLFSVLRDGHLVRLQQVVFPNRDFYLHLRADAALAAFLYWTASEAVWVSLPSIASKLVGSPPKATSFVRGAWLRAISIAKAWIQGASARRENSPTQDTRTGDTSVKTPLRARLSSGIQHMCKRIGDVLLHPYALKEGMLDPDQISASSDHRGLSATLILCSIVLGAAKWISFVNHILCCLSFASGGLRGQDVYLGIKGEAVTPQRAQGSEKSGGSILRTKAFLLDQDDKFVVFAHGYRKFDFGDKADDRKEQRQRDSDLRRETDDLLPLDSIPGRIYKVKLDEVLWFKQPLYSIEEFRNLRR